MKVILAIERCSIEERELEFDETTQSLESLKEDIKGWYDSGLFNDNFATEATVHAIIFDREGERKLFDFRIK